MKTSVRAAAVVLGVLLLALAPVAAADGFQVVINEANETTEMSRADVARIFLKKRAEWPTGTPIVAVDQERTSDVRREFSLEIHRKDPDAVSAYWQTLVYSGRGVPPRVLKSDAEVVRFVQENPGAVGYVSGQASTDGVQVLRVN